MRQNLVLTALLLAFSSIAAEANPFTPYLTRKAPPVVKDLGTEVRGDISLHKEVFYSRTVPTAAGPVRNEIYAIVARPTRPGKYPGILVLHGGGGSAEEGLVLDWAKRGFIAASVDLPGISNPAKTPNSNGVWKAYPYGKNRFAASPDATSADAFDAVVAAIQTLYLLRAQPDVDTAKIGVTGTSWGGYSTIMVAGLAGHDVTAAFAIYGTGHYDLGTTFQTELGKLPKATADEWLQQLDAGNYTRSITADFVEAAGTNDTFFYLPAVMATLDDVKSHKNLVLAPNADHWMDVPGGCERTRPDVPHSNGWMYMQVTYFEYQLQGIGQPLPEVYDATSGPAKDGMQPVTFHARGAVGATQAHIYYSAYDPVWKKRKWLDAPAEARDGAYVASIPAGMDWFASLSDARPVTVSSTIHPSLLTPSR